MFDAELLSLGITDCRKFEVDMDKKPYHSEK